MPCSVASPTSSLSTTGLSRSEDETNVRLANLCTKVKNKILFHSTSLLIKVLPESKEATEPAMLPITVSSPVLITTPVLTPSTTLVE